MSTTDKLLIITSVLFVFNAILIMILMDSKKVWDKINKEKKYKKYPWNNDEMYVDDFGLGIRSKDKTRA